VKPTAPVREGVERAILASLPAKTRAAVAEAIGRPRNDQTFNDAWKALERAGRIAREGGSWVVLVVAPSLGDQDNQDNGQNDGENGSVEPDSRVLPPVLPGVAGGGGEPLFEDPRRNAIWGPE
jgi:hypothetical protein